MRDRSAPFKLQDIGQNYVRVPDGAGGERLARVDAVLEGPCIFIRIDPETGAWPFLLRNDSDYPIEFYQCVSSISQFSLNSANSLVMKTIGAGGTAGWRKKIRHQALQPRSSRRTSVRVGLPRRQPQPSDRCRSWRTHGQPSRDRCSRSFPLFGTSIRR